MRLINYLSIMSVLSVPTMAAQPPAAKTPVQHSAGMAEYWREVDRLSPQAKSLDNSADFSAFLDQPLPPWRSTRRDIAECAKRSGNAVLTADIYNEFAALLAHQEEVAARVASMYLQQLDSTGKGMSGEELWKMRANAEAAVRAEVKATGTYKRTATMPYFSWLEISKDIPAKEAQAIADDMQRFIFTSASGGKLPDKQDLILWMAMRERTYRQQPIAKMDGTNKPSSQGQP